MRQFERMYLSDGVYASYDGNTFQIHFEPGQIVRLVTEPDITDTLKRQISQQDTQDDAQ